MQPTGTFTLLGIHALGIGFQVRLQRHPKFERHDWQSHFPTDKRSPTPVLLIHKMKPTIVIIVAAMLSGCINTHPTSTAEWSHPEGHSADRIAQEIAKCRIAAVQSGAAAPEGFAANGGRNYWVAKRADQAAKNDFVRDCMVAKGYISSKK